MRARILALLAVAALFLSSCADQDKGVTPINLSSSSVLSQLCGSDAAEVLNVVQEAANAKPESGKRKQLEDWGITYYEDSSKVMELLDTVKEHQEDCEGPSTSSSPTPSASPSPDDEDKVEEPEDDGTSTVTNKDGKREKLPLITSAAGNPSADTTSDSDTPPSIPDGVCPILKDWQSLVDCVDDNQFDWYIDAVNERERKTGFNWSDIKRWAVAKTAKGNAPEVRVIRVYGDSVSNTEARERAVELIGNAGKRLQIVRQPDCFTNTRGLELGVMEDFVYCPPGSREVRVSLTPLRIKKGKVIGLLDTGSGVFVDCQNVHWIPPVIKTPDDIQTVCYSNCNPNPGCTHDCNPNPGCTHDCQPPPEECVEIPGNGAIDCGGKGDGPFHGGGVPTDTVSGHGQDPQDVETHHTGGGGVTDHASNPPGSQTGGQAGGGATPPDPSPTPNPPEGGDGDSDTSDGSEGGPP